MRRVELGIFFCPKRISWFYSLKDGDVLCFLIPAFSLVGGHVATSTSSACRV